MKHTEDEYRDAISLLIYQDRLYDSLADQQHSFEFCDDGDGWNEPFSEWYSCVCEEWGLEWVQVDPKCSDRPDIVDVVLQWRKHINETYYQTDFIGFEDEDGRVSQDFDTI